MLEKERQSPLPAVELELGKEVLPFEDCDWPKTRAVHGPFLERGFVFEGIKGKVMLTETDLEAFDFPVDFPLTRPAKNSLQLSYVAVLEDYSQYILAERYKLTFSIGEKEYSVPLIGDNLVEDETGDFDYLREALDDFEEGKEVTVYSSALDEYVEGAKEVRVPVNEIVKSHIKMKVEKGLFF